MSPESIESFFALGIGFAVAGMLASGYQLMTERPPTFRLLERGPRPSAFAAAVFLAFAAPFIIMRTIVLGSRIAGWHFPAVMTATVVAGVWSLMSGMVAISVLTALGLLGA
jgi:hypothetical protein